MTFAQAALILLLVGMLVVFALDRIRMEVVALAGLALGVGLNLVPLEDTFSGFANPAFLTVVEILLIVQVLGRSGLLDRLATRIPGMGLSKHGIVTLLCVTTAFLSVVMNNIGALALMLPVASSVCRVSGLHQRRLLMPVSFAALLGGLCSVIGTPANLIAGQQLADHTGQAFAFFDYAYVGVPVAAAGLVAVLLWSYRVLGPDDRRRAPLPGHTFRRVLAEVLIPQGSAFEGIAVADFPATIHALHRAEKRVMVQRVGTEVARGDVVLIETDLPTLEGWLADGTVAFPPNAASARRNGWVEAVVMPESTLVGSRIRSLEGFSARGVQVVAIATQMPRIEGSFADLRLSIGDVLFLSGDEEAIREALEEAEILPLWPRPVTPRFEHPWRPAIGFAGGIALTASGVVEPELAFGLVVLGFAAAGVLNLRRALAELDWPILIMLAAMIPLGSAVETTGAAAVLAEGLISALPGHGPILLITAILALAVAITPFVNNASTAIVLGPIAVSIATTTGLPVEPFLIAVALGASIDFLTPIGHHNNTIVMGLAGYHFIDFLRAGWPVTLAAFAAAVPALSLFWM